MDSNKKLCIYPLKVTLEKHSSTMYIQIHGTKKRKKFSLPCPFKSKGFNVLLVSGVGALDPGLGGHPHWRGQDQRRPDQVRQDPGLPCQGNLHITLPYLSRRAPDPGLPCQGILHVTLPYLSRIAPVPGLPCQGILHITLPYLSRRSPVLPYRCHWDVDPVTSPKGLLWPCKMKNVKKSGILGGGGGGRVILEENSTSMLPE